MLQKVVSVLFFSLIALPLHADNYADHAINNLYKRLHSQPLTMAERLEKVSAAFLGKPYELGALGEGCNAPFDQSPLYRTDSFDCETYVDTVLAIALADTHQIFQQCINKVRYANGQVSFITRNHFTSLDWNINNQQQGFLKDITFSLKDSHQEIVAKRATAFIDKPNWYRHLTADRIKLHRANPAKAERQLALLQKQGERLPAQEASIFYLPLTSLFDEQGTPNYSLFAQIPNASIIEIVRPDWNLRKEIGTNLNVSHLGFAFWNNKKLLFRHASASEQKVVEVSLIDYLDKTRSSPTIKGINVQIIVPDKPLTNQCIAANH